MLNFIRVALIGFMVLLAAGCAAGKDTPVKEIPESATSTVSVESWMTEFICAQVPDQQPKKSFFKKHWRKFMPWLVPILAGSNFSDQDAIMALQFARVLINLGLAEAQAEAQADVDEDEIAEKIDALIAMCSELTAASKK